jgi:hypothetical protein
MTTVGGRLGTADKSIVGGGDSKILVSIPARFGASVMREQAAVGSAGGLDATQIVQGTVDRDSQFVSDIEFSAIVERIHANVSKAGICQIVQLHRGLQVSCSQAEAQ